MEVQIMYKDRKKSPFTWYCFTESKNTRMAVDEAIEKFKKQQEQHKIPYSITMIIIPKNF